MNLGSKQTHGPKSSLKWDRLVSGRDWHGPCTPLPIHMYENFIHQTEGTYDSSILYCHSITCISLSHVQKSLIHLTLGSILSIFLCNNLRRKSTHQIQEDDEIYDISCMFLPHSWKLPLPFKINSDLRGHNSFQRACKRKKWF